jgi:hypothetical protein
VLEGVISGAKNKAPSLPFNRETILNKYQKIQKKNKTNKNNIKIRKTRAN